MADEKPEVKAEVTDEVKPAVKKPAKSEGKKQKAKRNAVKVHTCYDISSGLKRKNKTCPKCGGAVFMAQHKNRTTCGKCNYTEFSRKEEPVKDEPSK